MTSEMTEDDTPSATPPVRRSRAARWLRIVSIVGGIGFLISCVICLGLLRIIAPSVVTAPAEVRGYVQEIADFDDPAGWKPVVGMKSANFAYTARGGLYQHETGRGGLRLYDVQVGSAPLDQADELFVRLLESQDIVSFRKLQPTRSEPRKLTIRGLETEVTFREGQDISSTTKLHEVTATLTGKNGPARLLIQMESDLWNEDAIVRWLESIR